MREEKSLQQPLLILGAQIDGRVSTRTALPLTASPVLPLLLLTQDESSRKPTATLDIPARLPLVQQRRSRFRSRSSTSSRWSRPTPLFSNPCVPSHRQSSSTLTQTRPAERSSSPLAFPSSSAGGSARRSAQNANPLFAASGLSSDAGGSGVEGLGAASGRSGRGDSPLFFPGSVLPLVLPLATLPLTLEHSLKIRHRLSYPLPP